MIYQSIQQIGIYTQWMIGIAVLFIILRCVHIIMRMSNSMEENISMQAIGAKVWNHVKAILICVCVTAIIEFVKGYWNH